MYIRCWGSRGSIPVCGKEFVRYGGDTTCIEIRSETGDVVIVDAGTGMRRLGHRLAQEGVPKLTLLFTHAHLDHLLGLPFFLPLYRSGTAIRILGKPFGTASYKAIIDGVMADPYFPVRLDSRDVKAKVTFGGLTEGRKIRIGPISVLPVGLSHPNNGGLGFRFEEEGKSFVFLTDNELSYRHPGGESFERYVSFCRDADLLFHDAEYTPRDYNPSWGHSLFGDAVRLAAAARVKALGLFHHNNMRSDRQIDAIVRRARSSLAKADGHTPKCFAVSNRFSTRL